MFFIKELRHTILLHPSYFGPRMLNFLESKLYSDVEGTCSGQFGYIIAVVSILDIGKGTVLSGSGQAEFITRYRAIVFKPFKGEVVDGVVNNVTKMGFFADVGPLNVFVSHQVRLVVSPFLHFYLAFSLKNINFRALADTPGYGIRPQLESPAVHV
ncbi:DNA-directed RNA polymerase II subunit [Marasmius crinis-equi]|uniref:DNA-directed RNA polymerase II subunit n=1 Tax=Marasmius crinis-equi TaxID=585013 RepID=A0ABR3F0S7_9AGAR